jgi:hypothetical protein
MLTWDAICASLGLLVDVVLMMDTHYLFPEPFVIQNNVVQENRHFRATFKVGAGRCSTAVKEIEYL